MTNAWTPGPWELVLESTDGDNFAVSIYGDGFKGLLIARCSQNGYHLHDARLIAAAPDMAEALEEAVLVLSALSPEDESLYGPRALTLARAALAKARGEAP